MAGLGFFKPQATGVRAGDIPKFGDLSAQEKLMMLGATLRGDMKGAQAIPMMAAARARQAAEREWRGGLAEDLKGVPMQRQVAIQNDVGEDISAGFAPQTETVRGPRPTLRDLVPRLMEGRNRGYDIKDDLELLKAVDPSIKYEGGLRYDERDPSSAPKFIPKLQEGQEPLFDSRGNIVGIRNMDGSIKAAADMAGAVTSAQERAKAGYSVERLPTEDGAEVPVLRSDVPALLGGGGQGGGQGVPGLSSGAPRFRTQTPAERETAVGRAKTDVEIEALTPKAKSALETLNRKTDFVLDTLKKARGQATGGLGGGAGLNSLLAGVPETAAFDLRSTLDTIEAAIGFDELQTMRDNSPTGGAVGNLTERELSLLSSLRGSLKAGQSPEQLQANIDREMTELQKITKERRSAFDRQYGAGRKAAPSGSGGGGRITPEQARAELARRRAAAGAR